MTTIGITSVGSGVGQSVLRALALGELDARTVGMDVAATNSGIHWTDVPLLIPPVRAGDAHRAALLEAVGAHAIDILIPGNDQELAPIAGAQAELAALGCTPIVSSPAAVLLSGDKLAMARWSAARGLPFIETWALPEARDRADDLPYPVIVKPRTGSASDGIALIHGPAALGDLEGGDEIIVQPYLPPVTRDLRVDEARGLEQKHEVSAQYLLSPSGAVLGSFVSIHRLKAGVPIEVVPVDDEPWAQDGRALLDALAAEGAVGPVNIQGRLTPEGRVVFFEANLRFTGITGVRALMGYREVEAAIRSLVDGDDAAATALLQRPGGLVGFRHVGDSVVPADRVSRLVRDGRLDAAPPATRPASFVVTGASSYLGRSTVDALLADDAVESVQVVVRPGTELPPRWSDERLVPIVGDVLDDDLALPEADVLVHLAALRAPAVTAGRVPGLYETNVEGTARVARAAGRAGIRRIVAASSQSVYGTSRPPLWPESLPLRPESDYALTKQLAESVLRGFDDLEVVALRYARLFGAADGMRWAELPHKFARAAVDVTPVEIDGSGGQRMDLLHVRDAARAALAAAAAPTPTGFVAVNIGGGSPLSVLGLARAVSAAARRAGLAELEIRHRGDASTTLGASFGMHIRRARALMGWSPSIALDDAIDGLLAAARQ